jgi:starch synthase/alpha-amylase
VHTTNTTLAEIEDNGIDAADFWDSLYYERMPHSYEESRDSNCVDLLVSGIFACHFVNTVSPTFLKEIVEGYHQLISPSIRQELINKYYAGCAFGILNAPDASFDPSTDKALVKNYSIRNVVSGKRENKIYLQKKLGLIKDENAPLFFWPSRLDPNQKGCQLLSDILYEVVSKYWEDCLEIVFVADGEFFNVFEDIVQFHGIYDRVKVCHFDETLSRQAFAASDFILMPSSFEPCGLPQMIAPKYGSLPVAHDTGGIHDTISDLDVEQGKGNGFLFKYFDSQGLFWAIDKAMEFYKLPRRIKTKNIMRIMREAKDKFNHSECAKKYIELYEKMLQRPL